MSDATETKTDQDERAIVTLRHPIPHGRDGLIEQLAFREGELGDMVGVSVGKRGLEVDQLITIAARMCGQPAAVLKKLRGQDAAEVVAIAMGFFSLCLATGGDDSDT